MIHIPQHIRELKSYHPGKSVEEYRKEFGFRETAMLWNNENNLGVPEKAGVRVREALDSLNLYPDPLAIELRSRLAEMNGVGVENVAVENGSESILANVFKAFVQPGEELLTSSGTFVAVYIWAKSSNVPVRLIPLTEHYRFDLEALQEAIRPETKVIYLSNPNNPTGAMISREELDEFLQVVPVDTLVIVDEAYYEYARNLSDDYPDSTRLHRANVLTLRTFSKAYGLAGARLGYAMGPERLITALNKVKMTFAPSALTLAAGLGALEDQDFLERTLRMNTEALTYFTGELRQRGYRVVEPYANFVMIDLETEERARTFSQEMLQRGVFVRALPAFGLPHCVRISTGRAEENELFVKMLDAMP